jgi:hypothetical protein
MIFFQSIKPLEGITMLKMNLKFKRTAHIVGGVFLSAALAACGGGGSAAASADLPPAGDPPVIGPVLTTGVASLVGDWVQNGCLAQGGQSFKTLTRATQLTATSFTYSFGTRTYNTTDCTGSFTLTGPTSFGTVVINRSDSNASGAANWGIWTTITNTQSAVVWGKKSETVLCILGDATPSVLPTLAEVISALNIQPAIGCATKI